MRIRKIAAALLALLLIALPALAQPSHEAPPVSLSLSYFRDNAPVSGAEFSLYMVAEEDESGKLIPSYLFQRYPIDFGDFSESSLMNLATTLQAYVLQDGIEAGFSGRTDADGCLRFSYLRQGMYLLMGKRYAADGKAYSPQPVLVMLPGTVPDTGELAYDVSISIKYDTEINTTEPLKLKALKIWEDEGYVSHRPQSITLRLLCDGAVYDTKVLTAANNWRWTWENLESDHQWLLTEDTVDGYNTRISREGITFLITNTFISKVTPVPENTATPTPGPSDDPGQPTPTPGASDDPGQPTPTPGASDDPGQPTPTPGSSDDPGQPTPTPGASDDPGQPTPTPGASDDPGQPTPTPGASDDPDQPTPTPGPSDDPGQPTPTPGASDDPGQPTPTPGASDDPGQPTPTPGASDDPDQPTPTPGPSDDPGQPTPTPGASDDPGQPTPTPGASDDPGQPTPTPGPSDDPSQPTPVPSDRPDEPTPIPTDKPDKPDNPKLPQTGQYWWPVPMLIAAGLLLIIFGLIRQRSEDYEK